MKAKERRESIFKMLFMQKYHKPDSLPEAIENYLDGLEEPHSPSEDEYMRLKCLEAIKHFEEMDDMINEVSEGWATRRMNLVDLSILRLAIFEMFYDADIPVKVAANEAVELAKVYGGENSPRFVNGILGKIASKYEQQMEEAEKVSFPRPNPNEAKEPSGEADAEAEEKQKASGKKASSTRKKKGGKAAASSSKSVTSAEPTGAGEGLKAGAASSTGTSELVLDVEGESYVLELDELPPEDGADGEPSAGSEG